MFTHKRRCAETPQNTSVAGLPPLRTPHMVAASRGAPCLALRSRPPRAGSAIVVAGATVVGVKSNTVRSVTGSATRGSPVSLLAGRAPSRRRQG